MFANTCRRYGSIMRRGAIDSRGGLPVVAKNTATATAHTAPPTLGPDVADWRYGTKGGRYCSVARFNPVPDRAAAPSAPAQERPRSRARPIPVRWPSFGAPAA